MVKNQIIVLISFLDWDFPCDYEKQTAKILSQKNKVFVFNPIFADPLWKIALDKKRRNSFYKRIYSLNKKLSLFPSFYLFPSHRIKVIEKLNQTILNLSFQLFIKAYCFLKTKKPTLWMFFPEEHIFIGKFKEKFSLYDCVDYHSSVDPLEDKIKKKSEKTMFQKVDIVFTNSPALYRLKKKLHSKVFQVPQGANMEIFLKTSKQPLPKELKKIPKPIIGFTGNINFRLDFPLIKKLAFTHSEWSFVFVGPIAHNFYQDKIVNFPQKLKELKRFKNIYFISRKTKKQLVAYLDHFNICWIPYNVSQEFNRYCYPIKVFEYFCRGKPVVSTPIESLIPLQPYVKIARDAKGFEKEIKKILKNGWPKEYKKEQKKLALANSWEKKIEKISQILDRLFPK